MKRHLLRPDAHWEPQEPPVWARHRRCEHGGSAPCPWPGCEAGVAGEQLVVPGPYAVRYFRRHRTLDVQHGRLGATWTWVEARAVNLVEMGRSA